MADGVRHGKFLWPATDGQPLFVRDATYTLSAGISPGAASLTCHTGRAPQMGGMLVITDGVGEIRLPGCKVDSVKFTGNNTALSVTILDRRWRWREFGGISGEYNRVDPYGRPIKWTVKTVKELMELCLRDMGERNWTIDLPASLRAPATFDPERPAPGAYPQVSWQRVPPAQALASLCDAVGCLVLYRPATDTVLIAPRGQGALLPDTNVSINSDGPSLDLPERPDKLIVVGQPVRYQARFRLEPVGEDWDGSIRPINELSYRPTGDGVIHEVRLVPVADSIGNDYTVTVTDRDGIAAWTFRATTATEAAISTGLAAAINAEPRPGYSAEVDGDTVLLSGPGHGAPFTTETDADVGTGGGTPSLAWELVTQGFDTRHPWEQCPTTTMGSAVATDRLTRLQAMEKARQWVYRAYRIRNVDSATDSKGPLKIPEYEKPIERIQQIVLQQTRVEQITPQLVDDALFDDQGRPRRVLVYDGHTRDKPARCIGSYFIGTVGWSNSRADSDVYVDFSVDPERQLIVFSQQVYVMQEGRAMPFDGVLETACNVRDAITNALECVEIEKAFPPPLSGTQPLFIHRDDVQWNVAGVYDDDTNRLTGSVTDYPEAAKRAGYYLDAYALQYLAESAQERTYNGIEPIGLDGAVQQVTWRVGSGGASTQASRNSEHSRVVPPYPARRRTEAMDPVQGGKQGAQPPVAGAGGIGGQASGSLWEGKQ